MSEIHFLQTYFPGIIFPIHRKNNVTHLIGVSSTNKIAGNISVTTPKTLNELSSTVTQTTVRLQQFTLTEPPPPMDENQLPEILSPFGKR